MTCIKTNIFKFVNYHERWRKIKHFLKHGDQFKNYNSDIQERYFSILTGRLQETYKQLRLEQNELLKCFDALSGVNIRRGLLLAQRLILNNVL